jgi:Helix-turn-helix domain
MGLLFADGPSGRSANGKVADDKSGMHKLVWLQGVATDPAMRGLPCAVAVLLALRYFHPATGQAWPSQARLARELSCKRQNLGLAIDRLVEAGWLGKHSGGRGSSNRYWLNIPADKATSSPAGGAALLAGLGSPAGGATSCPAGGARLKGINQGRESRVVADPTRAPCFSILEKETKEDKPANSKPATLGNSKPATLEKKPAILKFPDAWSALSVAELDIAWKLAEWDAERANREFQKFRTYNRTKHSPNWSDTWELWCQRGREYDQKDLKQSASTGVRAAALGMKRWLDEQKQRTED